MIRGRKGVSCAQFTAIKDGKSRIAIITLWKITSLTRNKEDSILTLFTLKVLERPPVIVYVSFGSYSFMS